MIRAHDEDSALSVVSGYESSVVARVCISSCHKYKTHYYYYSMGPPLWSSSQSSWLQIRRPGPGFDSWHYQKKKVVGLERGPLSLVSTTEELLDRKVAALV
jgi:hypothetical protein